MQLSHRDINLLSHLIGIDLVQNQRTPNFPPYNIIAKDPTDNLNSRTIVMALAGYSQDDIEITIERNQLSVKGKRPPENSEQVNYIYRGIAQRDFEVLFTLHEYAVVKEAKMSNGLLEITCDFEVPEEMKPRTIPIN